MSYRETMLLSDAQTGATSLNLASSNGIQKKDTIGITLDKGTIFWTDVVDIPDIKTVTIAAGLTDSASKGRIVYDYPKPNPKPPAFYSRVIEPPTIHDTPEQKHRREYDMWARTGGFNSSVADLKGLVATVAELNYSSGLTGPIQAQLDSKLSPDSLGTMAMQNANNVKITGGSITGIMLENLSFDNVDLTDSSFNAGTINNSSLSNVRITVRIGDTGLSRKVASLLNANPTTVTTTDDGENQLLAYNLPANSLAFNGDMFDISAWGEFAANDNEKTLKLYFGEKLVASFTTTANAAAWVINAIGVRSGVTSQMMMSTCTAGNGSIDIPCQQVTGNEPLNATVNIKVTGQSESAGDITQHVLTVTLLPQG